MSTQFTYLRSHSHFSLLRGLASPSDLVQRAHAMRIETLALTDINHTGGLILFLEECQRLSIKPILGVHLVQEHRPFDSMTILARNAAAYADICEITSLYMLNHRDDEDFSMATLWVEWLEVQDKGQTQEQAGHLGDKRLDRLKDLVVMTSSVQTLDDLMKLKGTVKVLDVKFGLDSETNDFINLDIYAEIISQSQESRRVSKELMGRASKYGIECVASQPHFFMSAADYEEHQVMRAIDLNSSIEQLNPSDLAPAGAWFKEPYLIDEIFIRKPDLLDVSQVIASSVVDDWTSSAWLMPKIAVPDGLTDSQYLRQCAMTGLEQNYPSEVSLIPERDLSVRDLAVKNRPQALEIQERELAIIMSKGYSSYFLMVKQIRDWANDHFQESYRRPKDCSVLRGSAANSITLYNLGASDLDPIRYGLYFERFLNEDRVSPPDADLDFGWDERDEVLEYIIENFGEDRCAMMCTTNTFRWKSAFREVAKVFGYTDEQVTRLMKEWKSEAKDASRDKQRGDLRLTKILDLAAKIEGRPRFLGQHCGGILITNEPIVRHVSCQYSGGVKNRKITQIDMHNGIDFLGLIKFDILGNGSLSVLRDALRDIQAQGIDDPEVWDLEKCYHDESVQEILSTSQSRGVFYVESPAQMRLNQKCDARSFEEIGITSSLVRPASAAFTQTFVERHREYKRGIKDWSFLHPSLSSILGETHDVVVYQEDVIRLCVEIAGLSFAQADKVRKMMNSMHEGEPQNYAQTASEFQLGCMHHKNFTQVEAAELWKRVASFQGFSFCQSHSMSYAQLSFKCAYLKAHHPAEFMASVISNEHGFYGTSIYVDEARRMGVEILPPCVQESVYKYLGREGSIRVGLMHVRGLRSKSLLLMLEERSKHGPYLHFVDFLKRSDMLGVKEIQALIRVSALDCFAQSQSTLMAELHYFKSAHSHLPDFKSSVDNDFLTHLNLQPSMNIPILDEVTFADKCYQELEILGFISSGHFLKMLALHPAADHCVAMSDLSEFVNQSVKLFGSPMTFRKHRVERSGADMLFVTMQDLSGTADLVLWPKVYERCYTQTLENSPMEVWGIPRYEDGAITFEVQSLRIAAWNPGQVSFLRSVEMKKRALHANHQMGVLGSLALAYPLAKGA